MVITDPIVLPKNILLTPVAQLSQAVLSKLQVNVGDYAITRLRSRTPSKIIDADAAELVQLFKKPTTIVQAILQYSYRRVTDPEETLEQAIPLLENLLNSQILVFETAEHQAQINPLFRVGDGFNGWQISQCLQVLEDMEVYQLRDNCGEFAVLKIARVGSALAMARQLLRNEAEILQHLEGGIAPKLLADASMEDSPYLLMEYFPGQPIDRVMAKQQYASVPAKLLQLVQKILHGYLDLHGQGVVHGDIHPGNVLVNASGDVKVVDFGFSSLKNRKSEMPRGGVAYFFEPEYARSVSMKQTSVCVSEAGEQYSLAALVYFLLTGQHYCNFSSERRILLEQILTELPQSFESRGVRGLREVEQVLLCALNKQPESRFTSIKEFVVALDCAIERDIDEVALSQTSVSLKHDHVSLSESKTKGPLFYSSELGDFLTQVIDRLQVQRSLFQEGFPQGPNVSVNYGAAGVAYGLYRMSSALDRADLLSLADQWIQQAIWQIDQPTAFDSAELDLSEQTVGLISPYHTASGVYLVQALIANVMGDFHRQRDSIKQFVQLVQADCPMFDLTLGKAGVLIGAALLMDTIHPANSSVVDALPLIELGDQIYAGLEQQILDVDLLDPNQDATNLGIAHGQAGLLYAILRWCEAISRPLPQWMPQLLKELAQFAEPTEQGYRWPWQLAASRVRRQYMPGWCNGSAGHIHLWTLAARMYDCRDYLEIAQSTAMEMRQQPAVIGNLCCGLAGQAYAFLNLYQSTGEQLWLDAAHQFAHQGALQSNISLLQGNNLNPAYGLLPNSLYKGDLGIAVLVADLKRPQFAAMPLFAREIS